MKYIDVMITANGTDREDRLDMPLMPSQIERVLAKAGFTVRTVLVLDSDTGLTGSVRSDKVQLRINKELDK